MAAFEAIIEAHPWSAEFKGDREDEWIFRHVQ
jgi:hypothetical protein